MPVCVRAKVILLGYLGPKNRSKKISKIHKDFELYQLYMHNFLCQNVSILPLYKLLTKKMDTVWPDGINIF